MEFAAHVHIADYDEDSESYFTTDVLSFSCSSDAERFKNYLVDDLQMPAMITEDNDTAADWSKFSFDPPKFDTSEISDNEAPF